MNKPPTAVGGIRRILSQLCRLGMKIEATLQY